MEPERLPVQLSGRGVESTSAIYRPKIENGKVEFNSNNDVEKTPDIHEINNMANSISNDVSITSTLPTPVLNTNDVDIKTTKKDTPTEANDDGLIEKEWVDRAKKIVSNTKDNPYEQEKAVNELQSDYLKKRYGEDFSVRK